MYIKHRGERGGVGGIFFDDLNDEDDYDQEMLLSFSAECANSVVPACIYTYHREEEEYPFHRRTQTMATTKARPLYMWNSTWFMTVELRLVSRREVGSTAF